MISRANLLNLINVISEGKVNSVRPDRKGFVIFYFHSLFWNVHPSTVFAAKIYDIKVLKPVKFQLCMFRGKPSSLYLQCKSIGFGVPRPKNLSFHMSCYVEKSVFVNTLDAVQSVFDWEFLDLCNVYLSMKVFKIILLYEIYLILFFFLLLFYWRF